MKIVRRTVLALLAALLLLLFFGRPMVWAEATLVMWDIAAGGAPTWLEEVTAPPRKYTTRWEGGEGDLYLPASQPRAAMVLVPGAAVLGRVEPNAYGRWAILRANASRLDNPRDARLLEEIAALRLRDRDADVSREAAMLRCWDRRAARCWHWSTIATPMQSIV